MSVIKYKDSNGNYVKIPANVGINNVVEGYYNETDNEFYEESTYETEITGESNKIYISLDTDKSYYWDGSEYKLLSGESVTDFDDLTNRPLESDTIDIDNLDLPMPAKPTEYPVLFDETGTEYQVGLYKRASDGKVKPVWRKLITGLSYTPTANSWSYTGVNIPNVEQIILSGFGQTGSCFLYVAFCRGNSNGNLEAWFSTHFFTYQKMLVEYTKTTDEFRDL